MITKNKAIKYFEKVEKFTGIEAINVRQLKDNATKEEIENAIDADINWFKGYADTIISMV